MPQKKNPDAAELIRAKIGRILGATVALFTVMKGLPLAYSKDMQEDKEQVFDAADNLMLALAAMTGMLSDLTAPIATGWRRRPRRAFHRDRSGRLAGARGRAALPRCPSRHRRAGRHGREIGRRSARPDAGEMQSVNPAITDDVYKVLGVHNSVASRQSYGGTAPAQVRAQIARWKEKLA
jgi:argininosuccinate lyase